MKVSLADVVQDNNIIPSDYVTRSNSNTKPVTISPPANDEESSTSNSEDSDRGQEQRVKRPKAKVIAPEVEQQQQQQPKKKLQFRRGDVFTSLMKNNNVVVLEAVSRMDIDKHVVAKHICGLLNSNAGGKIVLGVKLEGGQQYPVVQGIAMDRHERDSFRQGDCWSRKCDSWGLDQCLNFCSFFITLLGFDCYLNGQTIRPRLITSLLNLEFFDVIDIRYKERQVINYMSQDLCLQCFMLASFFPSFQLLFRSGDLN